MTFETALSFDDVLLEPQYSDIDTRKNIDISSALDKEIKLQIPIIASPMDTTSEDMMAGAMWNKGGLAIIHRYNTIGEQVALVKNATGAIVGTAVGTTGDYLERATALITAGSKIICIDVAHGHHILVKKAVEAIRKRHPFIHLMVGNVATLEGYEFLSQLPVQSIRVGIGCGSICSTRLQTGHGIPLLHSILECSKISTWSTPKIIADGGMKNSGDIVKALAAGADFVMCGSLLAGTEECPGKKIKTHKGLYKVYRGMSSRESQMDWRASSSTPEGIQTMVPYRGSVHNVIDDLVGGIKSGLSYSGARTIAELQRKAKFIIQTQAGQLESSTHILNR